MAGGESVKSTKEQKVNAIKQSHLATYPLPTSPGHTTGQTFSDILAE